MGAIGVICELIGIVLVLTHAGRRWYGYGEEASKKADEKNNEDSQYVLIGVGLMALGGFLMAS